MREEDNDPGEDTHWCIEIEDALSGVAHAFTALAMGVRGFLASRRARREAKLLRKQQLRMRQKRLGFRLIQGGNTFE
jgi:hypothetical protein